MCQPKICVIGSSNYDLIAYTDRLPKQGETILGKSFKMGFGGKGANQAVAAAKLGANVTMVTKLGEDIFGKQTLENYKNLNINSDYIYFTDQASSGVAPIWVDSNGSNSIIVISGANDLITQAEVESARSVIADSKMLLCQNEIPFEITKRALQIAKEEKVTTFFNPAPSPTFELTRDFFELVDILCLNETETELIASMPVTNIENAKLAGQCILKKGIKKIIITLGENGCLLMTNNSIEHIPTNKVKACDTTGAGDCFIGSFAYFSTCGFNDHEAIQKANFVASLSVQKSGTQCSFPTASELPKNLFLK